ncbi:homeobox protein BEL1 homolog isoform X1 [Zingiber officinale]|uniref:homeobox protein BEL1 homolog isoform X1 n=2 Tax=Zingiber officinale TaxID=94328 RepID=UPI001C4AC514|nr:homeobox protein BEL1 homolog isoform X1 [Zingiber officinale]
MTHQLSSMRGFCNNNHDLFFGSHQVEMESKNTTFGWLHHDDNYSQQVVQYSKNSKLARAAQELLCEFCSLAAGESSGHDAKNKKKKKKGLEEEGINIKDASWNDQSFCSSMDFMQLQKIKAKLLAMLEEIDNRYTKYCHQMRNVVMPFEAVAGEDAAKVYCSLASEAMSRHFRCLRDSVAGQLQALKKAAGEDGRVDRKTSVAAGTTLGETPRLKLLDQRMRQHKALRQGLLVEQPPWRPQRGLPDCAVAVLRAWLFEHFLHPYPNDVDKHILARQSGLSKSQVSNWFINARVRLWKPMIEEMYMQEMKELQNPNHHSTLEGTMDYCQDPNSDLTIFDQKPAPPRQLIVSDMIRMVDGLDLHSKYSEHSRVGNSAVSLSLGLQQHSGGGVSLSLLPSSSSLSLLVLPHHIVDHEDQQVQFSILDEEEGEKQLPYMNLVGAQLLQDLAR